MPKTDLATGIRRLRSDARSTDVDQDRVGTVLGHVGLHQLLLGFVLFGLLAVAGSHAVWSADEGALLYQVSSLAEGDGWSFTHPFPEADPAGTRYPLHLSSWAAEEIPETTGDSCPAEGVGCRYVSLAKHTSFIWISVGLYKLGGYQALLLLSMFGTLAAAVATSKLAARIEPKAEVPTLWLVGIGSPLFINGYVAWAHSPTAALFIWAIYWLTSKEVASRRMMHLIWGLTALAGTSLFRTEAALAGVAVGVGWLGLSVVLRKARARRLPFAGLGIGALAATALGSFVDRSWATATAGPVEPSSFDQEFGLISGRIEGFANTWLRPGYVMVPMDLLLLISAVVLIAATVFVRRGPQGHGMARPAVLFALMCVAVRFLIMPVALVPGLVVACPVLFVGLLLLDRQTARDEETLAILVPFGLFCGAVLATQYRGGGGGEWGGRYFAIGLPLGLAIAMISLVRAGRHFPPAHRRQLAGLLTAAILLLNMLGLLGLRIIRDRTTELATTIDLTIADAGDGDPRPVVVTTMNGLGRWLWEDLDDLRMLRVRSEELPEVAEQLAQLGIDRLTLVSLQPGQDSELLDQWYGKTAVVAGGDTEPDVSDDLSNSGVADAGTVIALRRQ